MGRRYKPPPWTPEFNDGPVEGVDVIDKVFFEKPIVQTIGTPTYTNQPSSGYRPQPYDATLSNSVVRLASSRKKNVCPEDLQPAEVIYQISESPTTNELRDYLGLGTSFGYGKGAIVARRYGQAWRRTQCQEWGIITYVQDTPPHGSMKMQGPYNVQWFNKQMDSERAWMEDLILIHASIPDEILETIITSQGVPLK